MVDSATMSNPAPERRVDRGSPPSMWLPKEGHRIRRRLRASVRTTCGEGQKLRTAMDRMRYVNSFPVRGDVDAHHPASLTFAPQRAAFAYNYS